MMSEDTTRVWETLVRAQESSCAWLPSVLEQLFDNPDTQEKEADGISATKALSLAAQQGQTIYTITKANYAEILPKLNHSDVVMTDIRNGVNAGKTVTVHDTQITLNGWSGTGYTILDPESGAGAYMIGGGLDGGFTVGGDEDKLSWTILTYTTFAENLSEFIFGMKSIVISSILAAANFVASIVINAYTMFSECDPITAAILMIPIICASAIFAVLGFVTAATFVGLLLTIALAVIGGIVVSFMSYQFRKIAW